MRIYHFFILIALIFFGELQSKPPSFSESSNEPWGCDSELAHLRSSPSTPVTVSSIPSKVCQSMIRFFQIHISPIDGARSSFYPTSSQYALLAIKKYGVLKGIGMGCDRLLRENGETWIYPLTYDYGRERKLDPVR